MSISYAVDFHPLYQSTRAQGMGSAMTAIVDDETAIMYNPAALAGIKNMQLNIANIDAQISTQIVTDYAALGKAFMAPSVGSISSLIGKNIYERATLSSMLVLPGFGIAAIYDQQIAVRIKNRALPQAEIGSQLTYGVQAGGGMTLYKFRHKKGEVRFGVAGKNLYRLGGYQHPTFTQMIAFDVKSLVANLSTWGVGYGADAGMQILYRLGRDVQLLASFVAFDIGDTAFSGTSSPQKNNLVAGGALRYRGPDMLATLSYEIQQLDESYDFMQKSHLGVEVKFPLLRLYAGLNQAYPSYGAAFDLGMVKFSGAVYTQEIGAAMHQNAETRGMVRVDVKLSL